MWHRCGINCPEWSKITGSVHSWWSVTTQWCPVQGMLVQIDNWICNVLSHVCDLVWAPAGCWVSKAKCRGRTEAWNQVLWDHEPNSAHYWIIGFSALLVGIGFNEMCPFPWLAISLFKNWNRSIRLIKSVSCIQSCALMQWLKALLNSPDPTTKHLSSFSPHVSFTDMWDGNSRMNSIVVIVVFEEVENVYRGVHRKSTYHFLSGWFIVCMKPPQTFEIRIIIT